jgi:catechol 2,3-dioxygenase-like lactoylglutathione lyase family enzyme
MPTFRGVNHFALSVTDLDRSTAFYTEILGLIAVLDFGYGRICLDRASGFSVGLIRHPEGARTPFSHLHPGLDHLGLVAADRDEIVGWEERFRSMDVPHSPMQETELGYHLNFRDPDHTALEFNAPTAAYTELIARVSTGCLPDSVLRDQAERILGPGLVIRP